MTQNADIAVKLQGVSFAYNANNGADHTPLYAGFDLSIRRGGITAIMGASGSGKSTLGKILGGELWASSGTVDWTQELGAERDHFYVDQNPKNVFSPYRTVRKNIAYAPRKHKLSKAEINVLVDKLLTDFKLTTVADKFPLFTSGGQQSRLALARVLSWKPKCIILDEYLSNLDPNTRALVIAYLHQLAAERSVTIIFITHSMSEALTLADRCIVLGKQPVNILADIPINLPHPRNEETPGYEEAEDTLIKALRHGLL